MEKLYHDRIVEAVGIAIILAMLAFAVYIPFSALIKIIF
jgi:hypothetical protein